MFVPKTYRARHAILKFLSDKRYEQQINKKDIKESQFTIDEIAQEINIDRFMVDQQLNVLYNKYVHAIPYMENEPNRFMINAEGIALASSKQIINDGKIINSQLFNNYASGIFQILIGLIAVYTIYANLTTINSLKSRINHMETQIQQISKKAEDGAQINGKQLKLK